MAELPEFDEVPSHAADGSTVAAILTPRSNLMDQKQAAYLQKLDERFVVLLKEVSPLFAADKLRWFREYIDHGEYGLALDSVQEVFVDEKQKPSGAILQIMKEVAETMEYPLQAPFANMFVDGK
jgi:hypothetical protein